MTLNRDYKLRRRASFLNILILSSREMWTKLLPLLLLGATTLRAAPPQVGFDLFLYFTLLRKRRFSLQN